MLPGARIISDLLGLHSADVAPALQVSYPPFDPQAVREPLLKELLSFWLARRDNRGALPARADIRPAAIKNLLPCIAIADVIDAGRDFQFRLFGTRIVDDAGIDLTGKSWDDAPEAEDVIARSRHLVKTGEPYFVSEIKALWSPRSYKSYQSLALPLAKDGKNVDMILYGVVFGCA